MNQEGTLGHAIKSARKNYPLTLEELGEKVGVSHAFLSRVENNKISKLLQKRHDREASIIKKQYPQLSNKEIDRILVDYREYQNLISATENLMDFPINYEDSNIHKFLTKDDIEELKLAIEEMTTFVESLEE